VSTQTPSQRKAVASMVLAASTMVGIAMHETFRSNAYMPTPHDVPTYGFGTTKGVKLGDKITPERAMQRLESELDTVYVAGVKNCIKVPMHDYEFGASVSLTYNIGVKAFCESTIAKKFNAGDYVGACAGFSAWNEQAGKVLRGLTKRRAEERKICEGG
jgi:lysozyme